MVRKTRICRRFWPIIFVNIKQTSHQAISIVRIEWLVCCAREIFSRTRFSRQIPTQKKKHISAEEKATKNSFPNPLSHSTLHYEGRIFSRSQLAERILCRLINVWFGSIQACEERFGEDVVCSVCSRASYLCRTEAYGSKRRTIFGHHAFGHFL